MVLTLFLFWGKIRHTHTHTHTHDSLLFSLSLTIVHVVRKQKRSLHGTLSKGEKSSCTSLGGFCLGRFLSTSFLSRSDGNFHSTWLGNFHSNSCLFFEVASCQDLPKSSNAKTWWQREVTKFNWCNPAKTQWPTSKAKPKKHKYIKKTQ